MGIQDMLDSDKIRAEIEPHLIQLRQEGWCVLEGVISESEIDSVREYVSASSEKALEAYTNDWISIIAGVPDFAPYLGDERVLGIVKTMFNHPHVRIAQTELKTIAPHNGDALLRTYHSDWPHDLRDLSKSGHIHQPFPNITMAVVTLWMLSPFTKENGGTWIVPRSHRDTRNPRGNDGIDQNKPIQNEMQVTGAAGSVLMTDSRIWHTATANLSDEPRIAMLARYIPWWVSVEMGKRNRVTIPAEVFATFPENVKPLYQHRVTE